MVKYKPSRIIGSHTELTDWWYGNKIPRLGTSAFVRFASRSAGILKTLTDAEVLIADVESGMTDGEKIWLPVSYFSQKLFTELGVRNDRQTSAAICIINGVLIHEGLHVVFTPHCRMDGFQRDYPADMPEEYLRTQAFLFIMNIVEDLYIENKCFEEYGGLSKFIEAKNWVAFSDEVWSLFCDRNNSWVLDPEEAPLTAHQTLQMLTWVKAYHCRDFAIFKRMPEVFSMFMEAEDTSKTEFQRFEIAKKIFEFLKEKNEQDKENGKGEEDDAFEPMAEGPESLMDGEIPDSEIQKLAKEITKSLTQEEIKSIVQSYEDGKQKPEEHSMLALESRGGAEVEVRYKEVQRTWKGDKVPDDEDFDNFARYFRYMMEFKHTTGKPMTSGSKLIKQRLPRILTDGKFLTNYTNEDLVRGKPKLMFLLDFSGSTEGRLPGHSYSLHEKIARCAKSAFKSLYFANVPIAVYAHTTMGSYGETPYVVGIASNRMPLGPDNIVRSTPDFDERFCKSMEVDTRNNYDGFAIEWCANRFPSTPGSNVLLVWSDGQPNGGSNYSGNAAIEHTKRVIHEVRRKHIAVLSMSLVQDVVETNDDIYGREYNLRAYGDNMGPALQSVLQKILLQGH